METSDFKAIHQVVFWYHIEHKDSSSSRCVLLDNKRQLHVLTTQSIQHQAVSKRSLEGNIYDCNLLLEIAKGM